MTGPRLTPPTDEQLAAIEDRWTENGLIHGDIYALTQEVRRLRDELRATGEEMAGQYRWAKQEAERAEEAERRLEEATVALVSFTESLAKAEAEVERLKERLALETHWAQTFQAERDRYKEALERIERLEGGIDPTPHEIARDALNQQGDTQSKP